MANYSLGLDFGTNSVRALIVDVSDGAEVATCVHEYERGDAGILLSNDPNLARQHPADYLAGTEEAVKGAVAQAGDTAPEFEPERIIGIGVDTTGSTPIPVDAEGTPIAFKDELADDLAAMAWLWKDHTSHAEAAEITELASRIRPQYLAKCGGTYSSEWFFSKILHCLRTSPAVFDASHTWVEIADWIPAVLCGTDRRVISSAASARRATRPCTILSGAGCPMPSSFRSSIRSWASCGAGFSTRPSQWTSSPAGCARNGRRSWGWPKGRLWPSALSMPIWGLSLRAWAPAGSSRSWALRAAT